MQCLCHWYAQTRPRIVTVHIYIYVRMLRAKVEFLAQGEHGSWCLCFSWIVVTHSIVDHCQDLQNVVATKTETHNV